MQKKKERKQSDKQTLISKKKSGEKKGKPVEPKTYVKYNNFINELPKR